MSDNTIVIKGIIARTTWTNATEQYLSELFPKTMFNVKIKDKRQIRIKVFFSKPGWLRISLNFSFCGIKSKSAEMIQPKYDEKSIWMKLIKIGNLKPKKTIIALFKSVKDMFNKNHIKIQIWLTSNRAAIIIFFKFGIFKSFSEKPPE